MTVYEDAYLSLTDFQSSPAEILFFPKRNGVERQPEIWHRGDYQLLTPNELDLEVEKFVLAREIVRDFLRAELVTRESERPTAESTEPHADIGDLFGHR